MKERPILFSTPMVQAVLANLKDITRRAKGLEVINKNPDDWEFNWFDYQAGWCFNQKSTINDQTLADRSFNQEVVKCPYGLVRDILWVRETWGELYDTCDHPELPDNPQERWSLGYVYKADDYKHTTDTDGFFTGWKPSIHMPKVACRLKLEIVSIRVERLHDITEEDAIKEGIEEHWVYLTTPTMIRRNYLKGPDPTFEMDVSAKKSFETLWASINGQESWDSNVWVWRIEFRKLNTETIK